MALVVVKKMIVYSAITKCMQKTPQNDKTFQKQRGHIPPNHPFSDKQVEKRILR